MAPDRTDAPQVPEIIEQLLKQLVVTFKAVVLYPPGSDIPRETAQAVATILKRILSERGDMRLAVAKEGFFYEGVPVFQGNVTVETFAREFYSRNVSEVRFHAGAAEKDIVCFLEVLRLNPADLAGAGGFESQLWERQCDAITVAEVSTKIVEMQGGVEELPPGEPWPPSALRIDELLVGAFGGRPRDQRLLVRVMQDPAIIGSYLRETLAGRGSRPGEAVVESQVTSLAHAAASELPGDQPELYRAIAEALMDLEPEIRRKVVRDKLLGDARKDEALAAVVRQMNVEEICKILVEGLVEGEASQEGVARAIRNLALISIASREEVMAEAGRALAAAGASEELTGAVLESASPKRLRVVERARSEEDKPVDDIVRLIDLAPQKLATEREDAEIEPLRREARRGITDGDIAVALVSLVTLDVRAGPFASVMSMIEDNIGLLLERGEFELAADVATSLTASEKDRRLSSAQRRRVRNAVAGLGSHERMRALNHALRLFASGGPEHLACRRLLEILGRHAIEPLLEVLAEEQDMATRKAMVELISDIAPAFIEELGKALGDRRWFFVRNVVAILGNTRSSEALAYLERTVRHGDARVRRETIRAVAGIKDRRSEQMLSAALSDDDAQNVALAARYLGASGSRGALPALEQVAKGEGRGNRDIGARVEAIEALGRLGSASCVPVLEGLASKGALFGRARTREIAAAAAAALRQVRSASAKGGAQ
ncbi:MAG: hypothetical protein C0418_03010 [Coriobacteriaceae bacterium]|nr:hypothetical protein [Coriobacteriaceae bacterium]